METPSISNNQEEDQIDLIQIIVIFWKARNYAIVTSVFFALCGLLLTLNSPNIYTAKTSFILKGGNAKKGGNFSNFASMAGFSLNQNNSNQEIPPELYPTFIKRTPFLEVLSKIKIPYDNDLILLRDYLTMKQPDDLWAMLKKYTIGLPGIIKTWIFQDTSGSMIKIQKTNESSKSGLRKFTAYEEQLFPKLKSALNISTENDLISLSYNSKSPEISAIVAYEALNLLQAEIIQLKTKSAKENLNFIEDLYKEKKYEYEALQDELAIFSDQNQNILSSVFQNKISRLEAELAISSTVNGELAKQVEQARIEISKATPIFTIIEPVIIPNQRSSPKRTSTVLGFAFLGLFLGLGFGVLKNPLQNMIEDVKNAIKK